MKSNRMEAVQSPIISVVGQWIAESPGTISLGQGVAFYLPPSEVALAVQKSLTQALLHQYHYVQGIPELISALAQKLEQDNKVKITADQAIVVTAGANMGLVNAVLAITEVGDEIILNTPYYFNHEMAVRIAGCEPVLIPTNDQYQLHPQLIADAITAKTKAVVTISPNNPTGVIYPEADLRAINQLCQERGIYHIHDEAYDYFAYDQTPIFSPASIAQSENHTISLYIFFKAYGMAGWRMGYMVIPQEILLGVKKIQDTNLICPVVASQYAALACLKVGKGYSQRFLPEMAHCRQELLSQLGKLSNCRLVMPKGAFYCFHQVDSSLSDLELVKRLITVFKVGVLPGSTFGMTEGCYLRIAYGALRQETAQIAME